MSQYAILTDLNRCVGCLACSVACKMVNDVPVGSYWNKVLRIGPNAREDISDGRSFAEMYFLPMTCQHCANPECVAVCPTGASVKLDDGTVQVDPELCIGCQLCVSACPYGVRYLNEETFAVEKCTMCHQLLEKDELPQCVSGCVGMARWFGDLEANSFEEFRGALGKTYGELAEPYAQEDVHHLPNSGNDPSFAYILRNMTWQGQE